MFYWIVIRFLSPVKIITVNTEGSGPPLGALRNPPSNHNPKPITLPQVLSCQSDCDLGTPSYLIPQGSLGGGGGVEVGRPSQAKPSHVGIPLHKQLQLNFQSKRWNPTVRMYDSYIKPTCNICRSRICDKGQKKGLNYVENLLAKS